MKKVVLYYADWCGHCKQYKSIWNALTKKLNGMGIKTNEYEYDNNKDVMLKEEINSFPTLKYFNNDKVQIIKDRSPDSIINLVTNDNKQMTGGGSDNKNCKGCRNNSYNCPIHGGSNSNKIEINLKYKTKYLKYKTKYLNLVNQ